MKVCILGPVTTNKYWGGVATFDEALAEAFIEEGHDTTIISTQSGEEVHKKELPINICKKGQLVAEVQNIEPDIAIASLDYGRFFSRIKGCRKVYFLHGFFNFASYGAVKSLLAVCYQKWMCSYADEIVSNSYFTSALNYKFWKIKSDKVAWLGADSEYIHRVKQKKTIANANNGNVLFAGRLVKGKGVDTIINAFAQLENCAKKYTLVIAGDGPLRQELEDLTKSKGVNVRFLGKVEHSKMYELYSDSEVFISLNETEPFGITYVEALLSGCKIICPKTGGQVEFLCDYTDRVKFVDCNSMLDIKSSLINLIERRVDSMDSRKLTEKFSYRNAVRTICYGEKDDERTSY